MNSVANIQLRRYNVFGEFINTEEYPVFAGTRQECCDFCMEIEGHLKKGDVLKFGEHEVTITCVDDMDEMGRFMINNRDYLHFDVHDLNSLTIERIEERE